MSDLEKFVYESKSFRGEVYHPKRSKYLAILSLFFLIIFVTGCTIATPSKKIVPKKQQTIGANK